MLRREDYQHHISATFNTELESLRNQMLSMGGAVEQQLTAAINALLQVDTGEAQTIIDRDAEINQMEMSIDDACATIIARRQPTASDLRLVIAIIKVNTDLERIGDEAAKIAQQTIRMSDDGISPTNFAEVRQIGGLVGSMLQRALDAFARLEVEQAVDVVRGDEEVDRQYGSAMRSLATFMLEDPRKIGVILNEMWALRSLERIGDHATNIAEHLVYLVQGADVRHGGLGDLDEHDRKG